MTPLSMAMDSAGHFLFVANQGLQVDPASGTVSVFAVQGTTLTEVPGSPFRVAVTGAPSGSGPAGVAVTPDGKYLYVSNQFDGTLSSFSVDASGLLTAGPVVSVGTAPSAVTITPNGGVVYVANASTVSAFTICNQVVTSCGDPNSPDGTLTAVAGSPFSAGIAPVAMVAAPSGKFLFVVNRMSNQISEFKIATGTGVLTPNTQATISTGANPVGVTLRVGTETIAATGGLRDFLYVPNLGGFFYLGLQLRHHRRDPGTGGQSRERAFGPTHGCGRGLGCSVLNQPVIPTSVEGPAIPLRTEQVLSPWLPR